MNELETRPSIISSLLVNIKVDYYKETPESEPTATEWRFSDSLYPMYIGSNKYYGVGRLMGITETNSEIRASSSQLTVTLSGIPNSRIYELVNSRIKGCPISVYRALFAPPGFDPLETNLEIGIDNLVYRFRGFVNNYSLSEDYNIESRTSTNTLVLTCSSSADVLSNKIAGRKTNPVSMKKYFPDDISMDRVPSLENAYFNFGAPKT